MSDNVFYLGAAPDDQRSVQDGWQNAEVIAYLERALEYAKADRNVTDCCVFLASSETTYRLGTQRLAPVLLLAMGSTITAWHDRLNATSTPT